MEMEVINLKIIKANNIKKYFPIRGGVFLKVTGYVKALENIDIEINDFESIGVVGESGCGKTTLGRIITKYTIQLKVHYIFMMRKEMSLIYHINLINR